MCPKTLALTALCVLPAALSAAQDDAPRPKSERRVRHALFVVVDGVYNSELMAPYDVLQHTIFRDPHDYIKTFVVSPQGNPVRTFEGITVEAHHSFADAPKVDILVIPSTSGSMTDDLQDPIYMGWLAQAVETADWVITLCDGAFPLAATGALNRRSATTFPADRKALQEMFPKVRVHHDVRLVADGKFITSVGGGMSYEPALYLVERLYGASHAQATAKGLVWPWNLDLVPRLILEHR